MDKPEQADLGTILFNFNREIFDTSSSRPILITCSAEPNSMSASFMEDRSLECETLIIDGGCAGLCLEVDAADHWLLKVIASNKDP